MLEDVPLLTRKGATIQEVIAGITKRSDNDCEIAASRPSANGLKYSIDNVLVSCPLHTTESIYKSLYDRFDPDIKAMPSMMHEWMLLVIEHHVRKLQINRN